MSPTRMHKGDTHREGDVSPTTSNKLPYEIWRVIIRYLPQRIQWQVRVLNRTVYGVVMNEMFGRMSVTNLGGWETERNIKFLTYVLSLPSSIRVFDIYCLFLY